MSGVKGQYVRRIDSAGRPYYVPRSGGNRVPASLWKVEREQIARLRQRGRIAVELGEIPPTGGPGGQPFPSSIGGVSISPMGEPEFGTWVDEDGVEWDVHEVDGDVYEAE